VFSLGAILLYMATAEGGVDCPQSSWFGLWRRGGPGQALGLGQAGAAAAGLGVHEGG
jgi:hypothetical protein